MTKYRRQIAVDVFGGFGLGWDGETPDHKLEWVLSNRAKKDAEVLVDYERLTDRQERFLKRFTSNSWDFIETRTKKEATHFIGAVIEFWKKQARYYDTDFDDWTDFYDEPH